MKKPTILVVDDSPDTLEMLYRNLSSKEYLGKVYTANSASEAIKILDTNDPIDLVITDLKMPNINGLDLIRYIRENKMLLARPEIIMITGYPSIQSAIKAVKYGAEDYLAKPFTAEELFQSVQRSLDKLERRRLAGERIDARVKGTRRKDLKDRPFPSAAVSIFQNIIGESEAMYNVFLIISKVAATDTTVLITGESGTGKELVARAIHYSSTRGSAPFVPVNCGGIPENLLESELFGYVKGAFTGALESRAGFFQTAVGGTIFLDEIGEMSLSMQVKLLRVLQDKEVYMVGSRRAFQTDVRILAATNKDLHTLVENKSFRQDLYYRLNVININIPPLRQRNDDILLLTHHYLKKFSKEFGKSDTIGFSDEALLALKSYDWPGNVRELENVIQRLIIMTESDVIDVSDLPSFMHFSIKSNLPDLHRSLAEVEAEHIMNVLKNVDENKSKAAKILGINRKTLHDKLKKLGFKE